MKNTNWMQIETPQGPMEAVAYTTPQGYPMVRVRNLIDPDSGFVKTLNVRQRPYTANVVFDRDGIPQEGSTVQRFEGSAAVSESARNVIISAARGVFGAYVASQGETVFDLAEADSLNKGISKLDAQLEALNAKRAELSAQLEAIQARLPQED